MTEMAPTESSSRQQAPDAKRALYAMAGVADLAVSTIRQLPEEAGKLRTRFPGAAEQAYENLVQRGESLVSTIRTARSAQQATQVPANQSRAAKTGPGATGTATRGATTSVRRAAEADAKAAKDAAGKVGQSTGSATRDATTSVRRAAEADAKAAKDAAGKVGEQ